MPRKDPTAFRRRFQEYKNGKSIDEIYDGGYIKEPVITPDPLYNEYINSLPDNQRLTEDSQYRLHRYWELNGKPKNFTEAIGKGMFTYDFSDNGWHANSVALNLKNGEYEFMKPNWHDTKMYEDAWYYSKDGELFRSEFTKVPGVAYDKYVPRYSNGKLPGYKKGTRGLTAEQQTALDELYTWGTNNGMDLYSIAGIAGNGLQESGLNPDIVSKSGYAGLFQNNKNLRAAIVAKYGDHSKKSLLDYALAWINGEDWVRNGKHAAHTAMGSGKFKKSGYKNTDEAADAWLKNYERAVILGDNGKVIGYQDLGKRRAFAKTAYDYLYGKYGEAVGALVAPAPIIAPADATAVRRVIPAEQTRAIWDGAENVTPYVTNKPPLTLRPPVNIPSVTDPIPSYKSWFESQNKHDIVKDLISLILLEEDIPSEESDDYNGLLYAKNGKLPKYGDGTGLVGFIKNKLYTNVDPRDYNIPKAILQFLTGERNYGSGMEEALWAKYLGRDTYSTGEGENAVGDWIIPAVYTPTTGKSTYTAYRLNPAKFSSTSGPLSDENIKAYFKRRAELGKNNFTTDDGFPNSGMGYYTMGSGQDENGRYISYYDDWDINPFHGKSASGWTKILPKALTDKGDILQGVLETNPYTLYDRRYLTDEEWKNLGGYKNGKSPIHIKPANRGKLTRLKARTGKSESELYNDGNPAHKKMVVFARNARKWKH